MKVGMAPVKLLLINEDISNVGGGGAGVLLSALLVAQFQHGTRFVSTNMHCSHQIARDPVSELYFYA